MTASAERQEALSVAHWAAAREHLVVMAWEGDGFDARGEYVETYWLPIIGPSCTLALRRFADWLEGRPDGLEIAIAELAGTFGLGKGTAAGSPIARTLARLADFGLARVDEDDRYAVRVAVPALTERQARRLPDYLAAGHRRAIETGR